MNLRKSTPDQQPHVRTREEVMQMTEDAERNERVKRLNDRLGGIAVESVHDEEPTQPSAKMIQRLDGSSE